MEKELGTLNEILDLIEKRDFPNALVKLNMIKTTDLETENLINNLKCNLQSVSIDYRSSIIKNIYGTCYSKKVLIGYIVIPFLQKHWHANAHEVTTIARCFDERGYIVDVADYEYNGGKIDIGQYDVVIGIGTFWDKVSFLNSSNTICIAYLTEKCPHFNNLSEIKRIRYFASRHPETKKYLFDVGIRRKDTFFKDINILLRIDYAIALGTDCLTKSMWQEYFDKVFFVDAIGNNYWNLTNIEKKEEQYKNFLWLGSTGGIHKGLDLAIEAFSKLPDLNLNIVGLGVEQELEIAYYDDIVLSKNIKYYGWLDSSSDEFRSVAEKCGFILSPSCSEGQCTSVLTGMFCGMIPVCTKENGIEIDNSFGVIIDDISPKKIAELLQRIVKKPVAELKSMSQKSFDVAVHKHTVKSYYEELSNNLEIILQCKREK